MVLFNYLSWTAIVRRMGTWTVATATARARHNLVGAARLPLLLFALQMGHIFNSRYNRWARVPVGAIRSTRSGWYYELIWVCCVVKY